MPGAEKGPALPRIELLNPAHDRSGFSSGVDALDRYLRTQAGQDARKTIAAPFLTLMPDGAVGGYYTLAATAVPALELPAETVRKLPKYPLLPATLLGRLAVDRRPTDTGAGMGALSAGRRPPAPS